MVPAARLPDHEFFYEGLGRGATATAFAHADDPGIRGNERDDRSAYKVVDQHHAGSLNRAQGFEGEQLRVARSGPYKGAVSCNHARIVGELLSRLGHKLMAVP